jgi:hypothetical protein
LPKPNAHLNALPALSISSGSAFGWAIFRSKFRRGLVAHLAALVGGTVEQPFGNA